MAVRRKRAKLSEDARPILAVPEMEQAVLGCLFLEAKWIVECQDLFRGNAEVFWDHRHRIIWGAIMKLHDQHAPTDVIAVINALRKSGILENCGGVAYVASLPDCAPNASFYLHAAPEVVSMFTRRQMVSACESIIEQAYELSGDIKEFTGAAEREVFTAGALSGNATGEHRIRDAMTEHHDELEKRWRGEVGVKTGFTDIDAILGTMDRGHVIVIGAAPSVGKTTIALNVVAHICQKGIGVGMFSLEMSAAEICGRLASMKSEIPLQRAMRAELHSDDMTIYQVASRSIASWPLWVVDDSSMTVARIRGRARRMAAEHDIGLIVVDYMQLVESGIKTTNRNDAVGHVSRELKAMARELKLPVIVLAQLSREHRKFNKRPDTFDLRESGGIEADADKIILLHPVKDTANVRFIIAKNRNEATGSADLKFNKPIFRFQEVTPEE